MKLKKLSVLFLSALLLFSVLSACGTTVVVVEGGRPAEPAATPAPTAGPTATPDTNPAPAAGGAVKTGLAIIPSVAESTDASADGGGTAQSDIVLVAVTVDGDGVIDQCVIDSIQAKINFNTSGALTTPVDTTFPTKNELGRDYGMVAASSIGKEWNEQAAALAAYARGKTVTDLRTMAVGEDGKAADVDLASSVTLYIGGFIDAIEAAVNSAMNLGASRGDKLGLAAVTEMSSSKDASADGGLAQAYATVAAVTFAGDTVTSCRIDAVQCNVNFDTTGRITSDLTAVPQTKNQLGDSYGMIVASSIGKEWYEQAAAFSAYVTGKTVAEVKGLAVDESGKAADVDLAASVTIHINEFQDLVGKAAR